MKFSCERCGKRYATAETLAAGRVYKLKCKACGHLIVVKASAPASGAAPAEARPGSAAPPSLPPPSPEPPPVSEPPPDAEPPAPEAAPGDAAAPPPVAADAAEPTTPPGAPLAEPTASVALEIGAPEPAEAVPSNGAGAQHFGEATTEISMGVTAAAVRPDGALETPAQEGYVDLFSDVAGAAARDEERSGDDPFLAVARASLPDGYGEGTPGAPDPFAPLRDDRAQPDAPRAAAPAAAAKVPLIPRPRPQRSIVPLALIGAGVAVLVAILAFVMLRPAGRAPAAAPPARAQAATAPAAATAPPPLAAPVNDPVPPPEAEPPAPTPAPPAPAPAARAAPAAEPKKVSEADDRRARDERRRREREEAQARAERERRAREEREAREREARERRERERLAAASASAEPEGALSQQQIEGVLRSTRKAFDACIQGARGTDVKLDGRRVLLRLNIQPSGTVTYPTLDDVTLNGTALGSCLKSAARLMVFPKFKGDTLHVEVPLVMR